MTDWTRLNSLKRSRAALAAVPASLEQGVSPLAQVEGDIPDEHVITVAERRVSVDYPTIIQNNMNTDTVDLVLDGEWDGMSVVCYIGHPGDLGEFEWEGKPFTLPVYDMTGPIDVTVVGLSADGKTRLVTVEAKGVMNVIKSGEFEGTIPPEDQPDLLGQILAAKGDAEDAADAANSAATSATSAASSANSAASSANTAASSANSAATKANSAAVDAQNAYDTLQPYMATIDSCANILHREVGPDTVVTADDSFPCKPVEMVVYGNTVQNLWANPSGTNRGVTVTSNADGSITLSGTATQRVVFKLVSYVLKPGSIYTVGSDKKVSDSWVPGEAGLGAGFGVIYRNAEDVMQGQTLFGFGSALVETFAVPSGATHVDLTAIVEEGFTVSGTYRVMLNEGSAAEPWCPPGLNSVGDGGSVEVVTAGKNLVSTSESSASNFQLVDYFLPAGEYTLSIGDMPDSFRFNIRAPRGLGIGTSDDDVLVNVSSSVSTFTLDYASPLHINGYSTPATPLKNIQLELGSTATSYEPPNVTTTPIDLQGHTLNALPDGTRDELHIDGGGNVVLEKRTHESVVDGDLNWSAKNSIGQFISSNAVEYAAPIGSKDYINTFIDKLIPSSELQNSLCISNISGRDLYLREPVFASDGIEVKNWFANNPTTIIYKLAEPQTIDLGTIAPPTMAAPNVTAYVADDTPAEMTLDYVRDVNIVHSRLEERIAALELASATS